MKCVPLSRASAITCSAGSPVRNASSPCAIASTKLDAAAPETMPTLWTVSGPASQANGSCPNARAHRLRSSSNAMPSSERPTKPIARPRCSPKRLGAIEPQRLADQRVVADLGMRVEREVVAGQADVALEQEPQPLPHRGRDRARVEVPEQPVMGHHQLGAEFRRALEQLEMG